MAFLSAEQIREQIAEHIAHALRTGAAVIVRCAIRAFIGMRALKACSAAFRVETVKTELIVLFSLLRIGKDAVRFPDFLEFLLRLFISGIDIRMIFLRELSVC